MTLGEESDKLSVFFPGELSLDFYFFKRWLQGKRFASVQQDKNAQSIHWYNSTKMHEVNIGTTGQISTK
jgi:hypothetical protein